jgi:hypothetical protein
MCDSYCSPLDIHVDHYEQLVRFHKVIEFYDFDNVCLVSTPFGEPHPHGEGPGYNVDDTDDAKQLQLSGWDVGFLQLGRRLCTRLKEDHDEISQLQRGPPNAPPLVSHNETLKYIEALSKRVDDARLEGIRGLCSNFNLRTNCVDMLRTPSSPCGDSMYSPTTPSYIISNPDFEHVGSKLKVRRYA